MEYFKRLEVNELFYLQEKEKEEAIGKIVSTIEPELNRIAKTPSLGKKLECLIAHSTTHVLCRVVNAVVVEDVFNGNISFVVEKILERMAELRWPCTKEQAVMEGFVAHIVSLILTNGPKAFKSRGTNHVIRKILAHNQHPQLMAEIERLGVEYFLADKTRAATYIVYLDIAGQEAQHKAVDALIEMLEVEMLRDYLSFLYQKVAELSSVAGLDALFAKIVPRLVELSHDPVANYFVQTFIMHYDPAKVFEALKPSLHTFKLNSNILLNLSKRACMCGAVPIVEYLVEHTYGRAHLMKRLLFNEDGGFDSKTHKAAVLLLSVKSAYLEEFQLECISLYEKFWLFNKTGQKIVAALLQSRLNEEILRVFVGTMKKEILGLAKAKGGPELLSVIKRVADPSLRRHIRMLEQSAPAAK